MIRLTLALVAGILSLTSAELALRHLNPLWTIFYPPVCFRPDLYQQVEWGYRLWPSLTTTHAYPLDHPRTVSLVSNTDGFRSRRELGDDDRRPRIMVLGDSMVFGVGVEDTERFTELIEAAEPTWRIDNLGMVGYGPDLMLRALEAVGLAHHPDVVVVALFSHDLYRVAPEASGVGFPIPRFALEDGHLATVPYPAPPLWWRLRLVQGLRYGYWRYTGASFPLNAAIFERIRALATEHGFRPALVFLPGPREGFDDRRRRDFLRDYASQKAVPFVDLTEPLHAAGGERLYLPQDAHWNPEGHRVVATALRPFLADLAPPQP
jgi:hypothetical protein